MENLVTVTNLCYKDILTDVTMSIKKNSITIISGANKSGKTILLKLLGSLIGNRSAVKYNGISKEELVRKISFVFYDNLSSEKKVKEELLSIDKKIINLLELNSILEEKIDTLDMLSKKKVILAKELSSEIELLLLDNPCLYLSNKESKDYLELLNKIKNKLSITIVITTTNLEETVNADYLYILDKGKIVLEGSPNSVLQEERILTRLGLNLPFMVDLSLKLIFYEVLDNITLDMEKMVNKLIWK